MGWNPLTWFGSSDQIAKTADDLFDKDKGLLTQVGSWVGNMKFTNEEQAELNVKIADKAAEFVASTLNENTERSKTRRSIALLWIKAQLALVLMTAICIPWDKGMATDYFNLATSSLMLMGTGSIIVFFFGGYYLNKKAGAATPPK
jgi:hypothetical protein